MEGIKENALKLETGKKGRRRCIKSAAVPTILDGKYRTIIQNSNARQMERLFNTLPYELQDVSLIDQKLMTTEH